MRERLIGHGDQLSQEQVAVTVNSPFSFAKTESQDAGVFHEFAGRRNHDR